MESIYCNGDQNLELSENNPCALQTGHDYYFLITPTQPFERNGVNKTNASRPILDLLSDFSQVRDTAWSDDKNKYSLSENESQFFQNLATVLPPTGQPKDPRWISVATIFCQNFCLPGEHQPIESLVTGYWDEFNYFSQKAKNIASHVTPVVGRTLRITHKSIANAHNLLPKAMQNFRFNGYPNFAISDALYPPFDISMAVRLDPSKVNSDALNFFNTVRKLQNSLSQETIAIFEISESHATLHILNLKISDPKHSRVAMRIYALADNITASAIIESIISGRCFASEISSGRIATDCVVPYASHTPPLINRAQAYHDHLADPANTHKGIGGTWLPGGILAVAEGRWVWDIAFPFNNQNERQNSLININQSVQLHLLSSTTSGQPMEIECVPGRNTVQPPLCPQPNQELAAQSWSTLLGEL